jgi:hypothetical protein
MVMTTNRMARRSLLGLMASVLMLMVVAHPSATHAATLRQESLEITTAKATMYRTTLAKANKATKDS